MIARCRSSLAGLVAALVLLCLPAPAGVAAPPERVPVHVYGSRRIPLQPVPNRIGVATRAPATVRALAAGVAREAGVLRRPSADTVWTVLEVAGADTPALPLNTDTARRAVLGRGIATSSADRGPAPPRAQRRAAPGGDLLARLRADPGVAYAYAAVRHPDTGAVLYPTDRILVRVRPGLTARDVRRRLPAGLALERALRGVVDTYRVRLLQPKLDDPLALAAELAGQRDWVAWAEPDFVQSWRPAALPGDPLIGDQWHIENTGQGGGTPGADARLKNAWDTQTGDGSVVLAIVDDGVQLTHPDLASRIFVNAGETPGDGIDNDSNGYIDDVNGWDFIEDDNDPNPDLTGPGSHGTAVAGVAAAAGDNAEGGSGACRNCRILPVRISNASSFTTTDIIGEALVYAGQFADAVNNSWGGGSPSAFIDDAIATVVSAARGGKGAPVLFSNGNSASGYISVGLLSIPAGTYTFEWVYSKDPTCCAAGFDTAWLDNVRLPDGTTQTFEGCSSLPAGWSTAGDAAWTAVDDETRSSSRLGGRCAVKAGAISDGQVSRLSTTVTATGSDDLVYEVWVSAEATTADGTGLITQDSCYDGIVLNVYDGSMTLLGSAFFLCGTYSNQDNPLMDGLLSYPSSNADTISVGAAANFDRRSDYSQWGPGIDLVAHSNGGSLGITTTDVVGANGYDTGDYTADFGGTSSAAPLATGIVGLLLSERPALTATEVRTVLHAATRKIGSVAYDGTGWNSQYGYGALDAEALMTAVADSTPPADVSGFSATPGDGQVVLAWTNPADADFAGVAIRRDTVGIPAGPADGTLVADVSGAPGAVGGLTDSGLSNGTTYYYAAFAHDGTPNYAPGVSDSATPSGSAGGDTTPPGDVASFAATPGDGQASLTWINPADGDLAGVMIRRDTTGVPVGPTDGTLVADAAATSGAAGAHTDTGLTNGTTYYYAAFAHDGVPNYAAGATASATPSGGGGAAPPPDGGGGGGGCLVTYLTQGWLPDDSWLDGLRAVREWLWQRGAWGRALVRGYYRGSAWAIERLER